MQEGAEKYFEIDELLERKPISPDEAFLRENICGEVVLVTGAAGSVGSEIVRQILNYQPEKVILLDNAETPLHKLSMELQACPIHVVLCDIRNEIRLRRVFSDHTPGIVYHAAAYKHLPMMETHPYESVEVNLGGTINLLKVSEEYGVNKFVQLSTDKAVHPVSVMGATKLLAELFCRKFDRENHLDVVITRFGNVLGSNGSIIPLFIEQIKKGGPLTVTHPEVMRYFMTIKEAAILMLQAGFINEKSKTFVFDLGDPIKIEVLANKLTSKISPQTSIAIEYIGMRNGEKIVERLVTEDENQIKTKFPGITALENSREATNTEVAQIKELVKNIDHLSEDSVLHKITEILPGYSPSKFQPSSEIEYRLYNAIQS